MEDPTNPTTRSASRWDAPPTAKERTAVQQAVARLLDELAPERPASRTAERPLPVERHRTPRGCIVQGAEGAVTVSWFPDAVNDEAFGELQVVAWRGVVSRPGSAHRVEGATVLQELVLRPVAGAADAAERWAWRTADGAQYSTVALAAHCLSLLDAAGEGALRAD